MGDGAMAAGADESRRIDLGLNAVDAVLRDLSTVASTWDSMTDGERITWRLEWGNEMSRLRQLAAEEAAGRMSGGQAARCRNLVERARAAQASIDALGLRGLPLSDDSRSREELRRAAG